MVLPFLSALVASACIASPVHPASSFSPYGSGPAVGVVPVWGIMSMESGTAHFEARGNGWYAAKVLWIISPRFTFELYIDVDGGRFVGGEQQISGTAKARWRDHPSTMLIRRPGCLTFHVGGPGGFSRTIRIRATT
jgi:hypothetical protein